MSACFDPKKGIVGKPVEWKPLFKDQNDFLGWVMNTKPFEEPKVKKVDITK